MTKKRNGNINLTSYEDIFKSDEARNEEQLENVEDIPLSELHPFKNHPFKVIEDELMTRTIESIAKYGVLSPIIARPREEGGYEIISGHRRHCASLLAGLDTIPIIVRDMDDDAAIILMVDSNAQREKIVPSERAFAYKMKYEAIKRQGTRSDLTCGQVGTKFRSDKIIADENGDSARQVQRFIRLTELIPELLKLVDDKKIAFNPAVELSYLKKEEQQDFLEAFEMEQKSPSLSQAQRIKKCSQEGNCNLEIIREIMTESKKAEIDKITIKNDVLWKYFPDSYTPKQMQDTIVQLLDNWQKKRKRQMER